MMACRVCRHAENVFTLPPGTEEEMLLGVNVCVGNAWAPAHSSVPNGHEEVEGKL